MSYDIGGISSKTFFKNYRGMIIVLVVFNIPCFNLRYGLLNTALFLRENLY